MDLCNCVRLNSDPSAASNLRCIHSVYVYSILSVLCASKPFSLSVCQSSINRRDILRSLIGELFVNDHHQTDVGRHVDQIRHEALIETGHTFVPPCFPYAIPAARIVGVLILQPRANYLVWICGGGCDQFRYGGKEEILAGGLCEKWLVVLWMNGGSNGMGYSRVSC